LRTNKSIGKSFLVMVVRRMAITILGAVSDVIRTADNVLFFVMEKLSTFFHVGMDSDPGERKNIKLVVFYLPQFHAIPENDRWWGKGFTEWTNVRKGKPLFKGHYQPREPSDETGYYDLSDSDVLTRQVKLAAEYGIYGFSFYHYWFKGKRLLEKPVEAYIRKKEADFPFCLCWANEPWTRKWDGREDEILQHQDYGDREDWISHFDCLLEAFTDERAIKIDAKPVFLIYRLGHIANVNEMIKCWRERAEWAGLPGIYIIAAVSLSFGEDMDFEGKDIDATYEFAPLCVKSIPKIRGSMEVRDYDRHWHRILKMRKRHQTQFRGAFVSWDNTVRRLRHSRIFDGATPEKYMKYLIHIGKNRSNAGNNIHQEKK